MRVSITLASLISVLFGVWHFFVPTWWHWYDYIDPSATELVIAVRAINVFFSLCLVLFGMITLIFLYRKPVSMFHLNVILCANSLLWATRVLMQYLYPQGSDINGLALVMMSVFILTFFGFFVPLVRSVFKP
jgi:hypothetical protein